MVVQVMLCHGRCNENGTLVPLGTPRNNWRDVHWVTPKYDQLLKMLQNPAYAGIYVRGRSKVVCELDTQGNAMKRERRVPREQWEVFIENHHEEYISKARWERNVEKIEGNTHARGAATKRSPGKGPSLLAGLLRCRRCGHRLYVTYAKTVRYTCRGGAQQRGVKQQQCFSFAATQIEQRVSELLLEVVRPAGIEAAQLAAEQLARDHQQQRQLLVDRVHACREAETRAAREYKLTDETYTTVRRKLAAEWDDALQALHVQQGRLDEFDAQRPAAPTAVEREKLERFGEDLPRIWFDAQTDMVLKKQITRTLIEEILVEVDEEQDEIVLWIHWGGGHHTEHREPRRGRRRRLGSTDLQAVMEGLRKVLPDESIAAVLNREGVPTSQGGNWSKSRVATFRRQHKIAAYNARERVERGWLTQAQAATRLEISPMSVSRLVHAGVLPTMQTHEGLASVIDEENLQLPAVQSAIRQLKEANNRPLPADPNQLSLFPTTTS